MDVVKNERRAALQGYNNDDEKTIKVISEASVTSFKSISEQRIVDFMNAVLRTVERIFRRRKLLQA